MRVVKHNRNGEVLTDAFRDAASSAFENDGRGARILVLRNAAGAVIASFDAEHVIKVLTDDGGKSRIQELRERIDGGRATFIDWRDWQQLTDYAARARKAKPDAANRLYFPGYDTQDQAHAALELRAEELRQQDAHNDSPARAERLRRALLRTLAANAALGGDVGEAIALLEEYQRAEARHAAACAAIHKE